VAVEPVFASPPSDGGRVRHFRLTLRRGSTSSGSSSGKEIEIIEAKRVVVATGSTSCPRLPEWMEELRSTTPQQHPPHSLRHAWELPDDLSSSSSSTKAAEHPLRPHQRILVVGGGLTAVQLAVLAAGNGCREVCLAARRPLRVQQFDFGAEWMDRRERPGLLRAFLATDFESRLGMLQQARGVSTVPPEAHSVLREMEDAGRLEVLEWTEVAAASPPAWDARAGCWRVVLEHYDPIAQRTVRTQRHFERLWCATGSDIRLEHHPLLGPFAARCPVRTCGGLPCLTPHLAWAEDCELYVLGAPAALVLGPDGANLMGARTGAARAAHVIGTALAAAAENWRGEEEQEQLVGQAKLEIAALQFRYDTKRQYVKGAGLGESSSEAPSSMQQQRWPRARGKGGRCGCGC
jgi:hypothetical protein